MMSFSVPEVCPTGEIRPYLQDGKKSPAVPSVTNPYGGPAYTLRGARYSLTPMRDTRTTTPKRPAQMKSERTQTPT